MNLTKSILTAGIASALCVSAAQADVTVYITGATAYRSPAVTAIKNYLTGGFVGIYGTKAGVTSELNAANCAFRGTVTGSPALGVVTVKCAWGGSVGGVKLIQSTTTFNINSQPGVKGWIPDGALPAGNSGGTIFAGTEGSTTIIGADTTTYTFESGGAAAKPDAAFTDAFQSSALGGATGDAVGLGTDTATGKIAVIPFDLVVSNGVSAATVTQYTGVTYGAGAGTAGTPLQYTAKNGDTTGANVGRVIGGKGITLGTTITSDGGPGTGPTNGLVLSAPTTATSQNNPAATTISSADNTGVAPFGNITANTFRQAMIGGCRLPNFTGNSADNALAVYAYGRNADSGTRLSALGESQLGLTNRPGFHLQPTFTPAGTGGGAGGSAGNVVTSLGRWPLETVLTVTYTAGQGGYNSGGDLAGALQSPGSTTSAVVAPLTRAGWIVGYLGRSDSSTACSQLFGVNTAKRLTFNGERDWNDPVGPNANNVDGTPTGGFNDNAVREGNYQAWEFEHFYKKASVTDGTDKDTVLDAIASTIQSASAPSGSIKLDSSFHVTKVVEGGAVSYP